MKVLIAGNWDSDIHEQPLFDAFEDLGFSSFSFKWRQYLSDATSTLPHKIKFKLSSLLGISIFYRKLNYALISRVADLCPDILFLYRPNVILPSTLRLIRSRFPSIKIISYNNDNPFSPSYPYFFWKFFNF